ncbi:MAG: M4 family metallopeptidase [Pseudomonadota bacterium]
MSRSHEHRCACQGFLGSYVFRELIKANDPVLRGIAFETVQRDERARTARDAPADVLSGNGDARGKLRRIFDMRGSEQLPPSIEMIARAEGDETDIGNEAVDDAYLHAGIVYDFFKEVLGHDSFDGEGECEMEVCVNYGIGTANAYWNGMYMLFGPGDGQYFQSFTKSLAAMAHEMSHAVLKFSSDLEYKGEAGALNESFCDVMAMSVVQWHLQQDARSADWSIGGEVLGPVLADIRAVRTFRQKPAYEGHVLLGTDPQPKHVADYKNLQTADGGVHINSGIPNHAFYRAAQAVSGPARIFDHLTKIWFEAFTKLPPDASFKDAAQATRNAASRFGPEIEDAVAKAWHDVGVV